MFDCAGWNLPNVPLMVVSVPIHDGGIISKHFDGDAKTVLIEHGDLDSIYTVFSFIFHGPAFFAAPGLSQPEFSCMFLLFGCHISDEIDFKSGQGRTGRQTMADVVAQTWWSGVGCNIKTPLRSQHPGVRGRVRM